MKINVKSGDGEDDATREVDTEKLADIHAAVLEKATEFIDTCKQYGVNVGVVFEGETFNVYTYLQVEGELERVAQFWYSLDRRLQDFSKNTLRLSFDPHGH